LGFSVFVVVVVVVFTVLICGKPVTMRYETEGKSYSYNTNYLLSAVGDLGDVDTLPSVRSTSGIRSVKTNI
jgi:hypothetical protein